MRLSEERELTEEEQLLKVQILAAKKEKENLGGGPTDAKKRPTATSAPYSSQAVKPGEKRKSSRPPAGGLASKTSGPGSKSSEPASKTSTPASAPGPKERKASG